MHEPVMSLRCELNDVQFAPREFTQKVQSPRISSAVQYREVGPVDRNATIDRASLIVQVLHSALEHRHVTLPSVAASSLKKSTAAF